MLTCSLIKCVAHLRVVPFCVQWLNCGCGALQTGGRPHCSHGRDIAVSSPSTQDVGLDLCHSKGKKKKEQPAWRTPIIPNRPKRTIKHLLTPPCFPRSLADPFPQWCPDLRWWAIVRPVLRVLPGGCTHTPQYPLALAACFSISISEEDPAP